jgi:hypothetical protein
MWWRAQMRARQEAARAAARPIAIAQIVGVAVAAIDIVLAFPLAYFLVRTTSRWKGILIALSLAPLAIVQPIGVLSLVLTVLIGNPERSPRVVAAVAVVCAGVSGFVLLSTSAANGVPVPPLAAGQPAVLIGAVVAVVAHCVRGKARYLAESAAAAVLFGLGAAIMRVAMMHVLGPTPASGVILLAEAAALLLIGGWLMHRS